MEMFHVIIIISSDISNTFYKDNNTMLTHSQDIKYQMLSIKHIGITYSFII